MAFVIPLPKLIEDRNSIQDAIESGTHCHFVRRRRDGSYIFVNTSLPAELESIESEISNRIAFNDSTKDAAPIFHDAHFEMMANDILYVDIGKKFTKSADDNKTNGALGGKQVDHEKINRAKSIIDKGTRKTFHGSRQLAEWLTANSDTQEQFKKDWILKHLPEYIKK